MAKIQKNTLGFLGVDFQYKLINAFIERPSFFKDLFPIIDQNMFTESYLKTIVGVMREYYSKHDSTASYDILAIKLNELASTDDDKQCYDEAIQKLREVTTDGIDEVEDMAEKFFKQQNWIRIANEIKRVAGDGDMSKYAECERMIIEANAITRKHEDSGSPLDSIDEDLSKENIVSIPTGIPKIDDCLGGGLDKGKLGLIMAAMGSGKALPNSEIVYTVDGPKTMGEINVGDMVLGRDGNGHTVIGKYPQGVRDIYEVRFNDGVSVRCDKEHLWNVNSRYQRSTWKRIPGSRKTIRKPDYSFKTLTLGEIMNKGLYKNGKQHSYNFKIPMANPVEFNEIPLRINPYLMGYFIGDGCFSRGAITVGEEDLSDVVLLLTNEEFKFGIKRHKGRATSIDFRSDFKNELKSYYGTPCKAEHKFIHKDFLFNSKKNRIAILNGLMDSDGTCGLNGNCSITTKSKQLAEDVRTLVLSLGGFASITEKKRGYFNKKYKEYRDCGMHYEVHFSLVDDSIPVFRLKRKQDRVRYRKFYATARFIKSIEPCGQEEASCIKVDAEDELFLTKDFIVTHNTSLTTAFSAAAATIKSQQNDYQGYKVLHIVFEDTKRDINRKYFGRLTQIETKDLNKDDETTERARELLKNHKDFDLIKNNIKILHLNTGEKTASDIVRIGKKFINEGFKPDMIVIDYFECVAPEKGSGNQQKWDQETKTMRVFENGAKELNVAMWIPSQGNRGSVSSELITMDQGSGSIGKQQVAQVVMSITRSLNDIDNKQATIAILKNRSGAAGLTLNGISFNNGTCTINCDNTVDFNSIDDYNEFAMNVEDNIRKDLTKGLRG